MFTKVCLAAVVLCVFSMIAQTTKAASGQAQPLIIKHPAEYGAYMKAIHHVW
jgi:hypothetical protein